MMIKILFFPFWAVWIFVGFLFGLLGRFLAAIISLVFLLVGAALTATVIGAIIGIPLIFTGLALMARSVLF